jgi:hypothetical protein
MEFLKNKLTALAEQRTKATDPQVIETLAADIQRVERAIDAERELRGGVGIGTAFPPSGRPERETRVANETDAEFRARATRELEAVPVI